MTIQDKIVSLAWTDLEAKEAIAKFFKFLLVSHDALSCSSIFI
ncbi:hypothetical protein [Acidianus sp. RZ1]|nr:hypothetical protein [Acidianus sp. RZ1]